MECVLRPEDSRRTTELAWYSVAQGLLDAFCAVADLRNLGVSPTSPHPTPQALGWWFHMLTLTSCRCPPHKPHASIPQCIFPKHQDPSLKWHTRDHTVLWVPCLDCHLARLGSLCVSRAVPSTWQAHHDCVQRREEEKRKEMKKGIVSFLKTVFNTIKCVFRTLKTPGPCDCQSRICYICH